MDLAGLVWRAGKIPGVGPLLRALGRRYEEGSVVTIAHGHASGLRWRRHHRDVNGFWIGQFELPNQEVLARELAPGQSFFDVGANAGFFTLIGARRVGPGGRCISFDPDPVNVAGLCDLIALNGLSQCAVVQEALGDREGRSPFSTRRPGSSTGHLGPPGPGETSSDVAVTTLDGVCGRFGMPDFLKVDVEGAEAAVLRGGMDLLSRRRARWLVEVHDEACERDCRKILEGTGHDVRAIEGLALPPGKTLPHHLLAHPRP